MGRIQGPQGTQAEEREWVGPTGTPPSSTVASKTGLSWLQGSGYHTLRKAGVVGTQELSVPHYPWRLTWGGEKQNRLWGGPSELPSKGCCGGLWPTLPTWSEHPKPPPQDTFPTLLQGTVRTPQTGATPVLTVSGTQYLLALPEYSCMDRKEDLVSYGQIYHRIMRERGSKPAKA